MSTPTLSQPAIAEMDLNHLVTEGKRDWIGYEVDGHSAVPEIPVGSLVFVDCSERPYANCIVVEKVNGRYCVRRIKETHRKLHIAARNGQSCNRDVQLSGGGLLLGVVAAHLVLYRIVCADKVKHYL